MPKDEFLSYINAFMKKIPLPEDAATCFMGVENMIFDDTELSECFSKLKNGFMVDFEIGLNEVFEELKVKADECGVSEYTFNFIFLMNCTDILLERYKDNDIPEEIFWDTMDDLRCKLLECYEQHEVWGTFVGGWYAGFMSMTRFALGRFQYEMSVFDDGPYTTKNGITIEKNTPAYNFHIPSSGKPFGKEARIESYKKAYDFYGYSKTGGNMVLVCSSWLLYKGHEEFLPEKSNILDFMRDFDIVKSEEREEFGDAWRVFGKYHELPPDRLPRDTSLRRAFADRLASGGKTGHGYGVIVFDGEKIVN
ncbi:MAG: acyltransferase domain-containing protein [Oscillospiraceae bacterium]|nr:acyltransferase domain-containing protein [Oscillospiraceae bacterium]